MSTPSEKNHSGFELKQLKDKHALTQLLLGRLRVVDQHSCEEKCFLVKHAEESTIQH